ncbi:hypothetical protein BH23BAC1_BH23BAC1_07270 [soil metagenome]
MKLLLIIIFSALTLIDCIAASIQFHKKDAVVWHPEQIISGEISGYDVNVVMVYHDDFPLPVRLGPDKTFSIEAILRNQENKFWITLESGDSTFVSDTLKYTLGYKPAPIVKPIASINGDQVSLQAFIVENPFRSVLEFIWTDDPGNPAPSRIKQGLDSYATVDIPDSAGKYYFDLLVISDNDSSYFQTLVIRNDKGTIQAYNIDKDDTPWMREAILYQITPYSFVEHGNFREITKKLPELKVLGINTVWLQPIFKSSYRGQGYDVVDYFSLNPDFGTESELRYLIATAKTLDMKILFDVVLNHSSIHHPYAQDRKENGTASHYYDFYQHEDDGRPYSSFYTSDEYGFINYFWDELVNFNYYNEEVQRWMLEVCKYWVKEFDIDGYRFDAIWGVNARMPSFARRLRTELKSIKPEVLLLAEDKGSVKEVFELGFEAAYDWTADTSWVSQWTWEYEYSESESFTIFKHPEVNQRDEMLKEAIFNIGQNFHRQLRFMENNDLPRFIAHHGLERTKMAAALMLALPGLPMLYNGQEVGKKGHPYATSAIFHADSTILSYDKYDLFPYYQRLIQLRHDYSALTDTTIKDLSINEGAIFAFQRKNNDYNILVLINLGQDISNAHIDVREAGLRRNKKHNFQDILNNNTFRKRKRNKIMEIPMEGYEVKWLLLR